MKPWEVAGVPFRTEGAFWNWVKGTIRKGWSRHPVRIELIKANRFKIDKHYKNGKTKQVWALKCEICKETFPQSVIQIDHKSPSEQERWYDDIDAFVRRMMWVTFDDLSILCTPCHAVKTYMDANNLTWEQAVSRKEEIQITSLKAPAQKAWLVERGVKPASNLEQRKLQIREMMNKEKTNAN